jgi:hypothetical protein
MNLAFGDCGINKDGIDAIAHSIYGPRGHSDPHSVTAFNTFCSPIHLNIIEIEDEEGHQYHFGEEQKIKIKRRGIIPEDDEVLEIEGKDFTFDDIFLDYV